MDAFDKAFASLSENSRAMLVRNPPPVTKERLIADAKSWVQLLQQAMSGSAADGLIAKPDDGATSDAVSAMTNLLLFTAQLPASGETLWALLHQSNTLTAVASTALDNLLAYRAHFSQKAVRRD